MKNNTKRALKYVVVMATLTVGIIGVGHSVFSVGPVAAKAQENNDSQKVIDAITGASMPVKAGSLSLSGKSLNDLIEYGGAAYLLSTVNLDGSPYTAPIEPILGDDGTIRIVSGYTTTRKNIDINGQAILTTYAISCGGDDVGMHMGARLVLSRVGDKVSDDMVKSYGLRTMVLKVDDVLPLEEKAAKRPRATYRR